MAKKQVASKIVQMAWHTDPYPSVLRATETGSHLVLAFGVGCFVYDGIYMGMLYANFRELKLNPFTRKLCEKD